MRIALIAPFGLLPKGTVSARMMPLAHALASRGHMVRVVIPPWDDPSAVRGGHSPDELVAWAAQPPDTAGGVHTVSLPLPRRMPDSLALTYGLTRWALRPASSLDAGHESPEYRQALRAIAGFRAEVVHVFKPVGYSGLAGLLLSGMRVPWVLDTDDWEGPGGWADVNPYSTAQRLAAALQEALLPRMAKAVTAASPTLRGRAWGFGLPRGRVFLMPNGVWAEKYAGWFERAGGQERAALRAQLGLGDAPVLLLYTRFAEFPYAWPLRVLEQVLTRHPKARLLVVGSGFFGEESRLRAEAAERGMAERVTVTGWVEEEHLPLYLAAGDVALYPMEDTLLNRAKSPVKVLEPMLMALPVVAHRVGQAAEFVGEAGVTVRAGDVAGMAEAASALISDPARRAELGRKARERVWSRFNWRHLCLQAERAYLTATAAAGSSARKRATRA